MEPKVSAEIGDKLHRAAQVANCLDVWYEKQPEVEQPMIKYAMEIVENGNVICREYPLVDVVESARAFEGAAYQYPWRHRKEAACRLIDAGAYSDNLAVTSGRFVTREGLLELSKERYFTYSKRSNRISADKIWEALFKTSSVSAEQCDSILEHIDRMDASESMQCRYGVLCDAPERMASRLPHGKCSSAPIRLQDGTVLDEARLCKLSSASLSVLGQDIADAICPNGHVDMSLAADILPTVPAQDLAPLHGVL